VAVRPPERSNDDPTPRKVRSSAGDVCCFILYFWSRLYGRGSPTERRKEERGNKQVKGKEDEGGEGGGKKKGEERR